MSPLASADPLDIFFLGDTPLMSSEQGLLNQSLTGLLLEEPY